MCMKRVNKLKGRKGFTVVEVVVALALAGIIFVGIFSSIQNMKKVNMKANEKLVGHSELQDVANKLKGSPQLNSKDLIEKYILTNVFKRDEDKNGIVFKGHPNRVLDGQRFDKVRNVFIGEVPRTNIILEIDMGPGENRIEDLPASEKSHRIIITAKRRLVIKDSNGNEEIVYRGFDDVFIWKTYNKIK